MSRLYILGFISYVKSKRICRETVAASFIILKKSPDSRGFLILEFTM